MCICWQHPEPRNQEAAEHMPFFFSARPYQDIGFGHISGIGFFHSLFDLVLVSLDIHNNTDVLLSSVFMADSGLGGT